VFNLGLEGFQVVNNEPMDESILEQMIDGFTTVQNLIVIKNSLVKYGKTPQLVDLVGASFEDNGIEFSVEGILSTIGNFFTWAYNKLKSLLEWFLNLFRKKKHKSKVDIPNGLIERIDALNLRGASVEEYILSKEAIQRINTLMSSGGKIGSFINKILTETNIHTVVIHTPSVEKAIQDKEQLKEYSKEITALVFKKHSYTTTIDEMLKVRDDIDTALNNLHFPDKNKIGSKIYILGSILKQLKTNPEGDNTANTIEYIKTQLSCLGLCKQIISQVVEKLEYDKKSIYSSIKIVVDEAVYQARNNNK